MREILFRGKRVDNDKWANGDLMQCSTYSIIYELRRGDEPRQCYEVDPATVCQYTGLKDKNGKLIFEWDIVRYVYEPGRGFWNANQLSVISYKKVGFHMEGIFGTNKYACMGGWLETIPFDQEAENIPEFEVVGNIHDNPELIAEVQNSKNNNSNDEVSIIKEDEDIESFRFRRMKELGYIKPDSHWVNLFNDLT